MRLAAYLEKKGISRAEFAEMVDVSAGLVTQWCDGTVWPKRDNAIRIRHVTGGAVTPNDFLPPTSKSRMEAVG